MSSRSTSPRSASPDQLSLLDASHLPLQFRLDAATRRRGLAHVAAIRQVLAEQSARTGLGHTGRGGPVAA